MAKEQLKQIEGVINPKSYKPDQTADYSLLKFTFRGAEVEQSSNKASGTVEDFISEIRNLSNKIVQISSEGFRGDDLTSAIESIKPKLDAESDLMDSNRQDFQTFVTRRLNNMNAAERAAYQTTQQVAYAGKVVGAVTDKVGDALDAAGKQISDMADQTMSYADQLMQDAQDVAKTVASGVQAGAKTVANEAGHIASVAKEGVTNTIDAATTGAIETGKAVMDTATKAGNAVTGFASDVAHGAASAVGDGVAYAANGVANAAGNVQSSLSDVASWADSWN